MSDNETVNLDEYPNYEDPVLPFEECCPEFFRDFLIKEGVLEQYKAAVSEPLFSTQVRLADQRSEKHYETFIGGVMDFKDHPDTNWLEVHNKWKAYLDSMKSL